MIYFGRSRNFFIFLIFRPCAIIRYERESCASVTGAHPGLMHRRAIRLYTGAMKIVKVRRVGNSNVISIPREFEASGYVPGS